MINKNYLKYLNRVLIVLFSLLALLLSIRSSDYLTDDREFHKENFVNLRISASYHVCSDESEYDTSDIFGYPEESCLDTGVIFEGTASGLSLKTVNGLTYTITAAHFCNAYISHSDDDGYFSSDLWVTDQSGKNYYGEIVYSDQYSDLCLISSSMPIDDDIKLARSDPEIGERIYAISSPLNISEDGILLHFEGFFSGCNSDRICFFTVPATSGSSGSIVFNTKGEAVGMIQMVPVGFDSVSLGIGYRSISSFLQTASERLSIDVSI